MTHTSIRLFALLMLAFASRAYALYDPAREYVETPAVGARYPDPAVELRTPAFAAAKTDFTSHDELIAFVSDLARRTPYLRMRIIGSSQENRAIPLLIFARPSAARGDVQKNGRPTVLVIGQP